MKKAAIAMIILLSASVGNTSDIYRYTDANGTLCLTTDPIDPNIKYKMVHKGDDMSYPVSEKASKDYIQATSQLVRNPDSLRRILHQLYQPSRCGRSTYNPRLERSRNYHGNNR